MGEAGERWSVSCWAFRCGTQDRDGLAQSLSPVTPFRAVEALASISCHCLPPAIGNSSAPAHVARPEFHFPFLYIQHLHFSKKGEMASGRERERDNKGKGALLSP